MNQTPTQRGGTAGLIGALLVSILSVAAVNCPASAEEFEIRLKEGHPWRPPFGLDRVGQSMVAVVQAAKQPTQDRLTLTVISRGKKVGRHQVKFAETPPYTARVSIEAGADELILSKDSRDGAKPVELVRTAVERPEFEADAIARPNEVINPVNLGTILVPSGWLLLGPSQSASLEVAAVTSRADLTHVKLRAWFESVPARVASASVSITAGVRVQQRPKLPEISASRERDVLAVSFEDTKGKRLWQKSIPVMIVSNPPKSPRFGATYEHLRYDSPISVRDPKTGSFSSMPYDGAWSADLKDVVVWLPNGARFVFWRGSSYIPFWAGHHNTGACNEWAEIISQPAGAVDCVEPLMDKELRYGRVEIIESTSSRVHVRWSYQSTDFNYKVWGDTAVEDYYFYPDGFGTRVVNLKADPKNNYELNEFIILTPKGAYPFDVLPEDPVDVLFLDGRKHRYRFPNPVAGATKSPDAGGVPAVYRLRLNKSERLASISFNPNLTVLPPVVFAPFFDQGEMVTPCYWGSHWPLARGNSTGRTIDDRLALTPTHNSVMSWAGTRPAPLRTENVNTLDSLSRARPMTLRTWAWLIGMSDASDGLLLDRARSFATPPSLDGLQGARLAYDTYIPERRAIRLIAEAREVSFTIKPGPPCVNPVFEIDRAPQGQIQVNLGGKPIDRREFAWDGRTLWLDANIQRATVLRIAFGDAKAERVP